MRLLTIIFILLLAGPVAAGTDRYLNQSLGSGDDDGTSWANAFRGTDCYRQLNSAMQGGDDSYTYGIGYGANIVPPIGGTVADPTCYYAGNGSDNTIVHGGGTWVGGTIASGWGSAYSGNIYRCGWIAEAVTDSVSQTGEAYCVIQIDEVNNDTVFVLYQASYVAVDADGEFYHSTGGDSLYVQLTNMNSTGYDPADYKIIAGSFIVFAGDVNATNVKIEGIHAKVARAKIIMLGNLTAQMDTVEVRAVRAEWAANPTGSNAGCFGTGSLTPLSNFGTYNTLVACTANHVRGGDGHANGFIFYTQQYLVVESCVVYGDVTVGIQAPKGTPLSDECYGIAVKHNKCFGDGSGDGFQHSTPSDEDSCYGNYASNWANGLNYKMTDTYGAPGGRTYILNNTFYDCNQGIAFGSEGATTDSLIIKYNVLVECDGSGTGTASHVFKNTDVNNESILGVDSNIYNAVAGHSWHSGGDSYTSLAAWQSGESQDDNSALISPNCNDLANDDFSRASTDSSECSLSYGDWANAPTLYGAWQPATGSSGGAEASGDAVLEGSAVLE